MYFKLDINVKTEALLTQWNYKATDPRKYNIYDSPWDEMMIIENDEIKQLLARMAQDGLQSEERLRQIAREIEEKISDYLFKNFILTYFETSPHEDGVNTSNIEETWKRLLKYANVDTADTVTLPTTRGFIVATIPYVGIYSYSEHYSKVTYHYMATNKFYTVSIITKESIEWLHLYLKKLEEKVPNLAEIGSINTSYTAEVECNADCSCECGY